MNNSFPLPKVRFALNATLSVVNVRSLYNSRCLLSTSKVYWAQRRQLTQAALCLPRCAKPLRVSNTSSMQSCHLFHRKRIENRLGRQRYIGSGRHLASSVFHVAFQDIQCFPRTLVPTKGGRALLSFSA